MDTFFSSIWLGMDLRTDIKHTSVWRDWFKCSKNANNSKLNGEHDLGGWGGDMYDH